MIDGGYASVQSFICLWDNNKKDYYLTCVPCICIYLHTHLPHHSSIDLLKDISKNDLKKLHETDEKKVVVHILPEPRP